MLYTKDNSYPAPLPNRLKMPDGTTRTDSSTFTEQEIASAGYVLAEDRPNEVYPNKVVWADGGWVIKEPTSWDATLKRRELQELCLDKLADTDYKVIKAVELGEELDPVYVEYRQALRDFYNSVADIEPWTAVLPRPALLDEAAE